MPKFLGCMSRNRLQRRPLGLPNMNNATNTEVLKVSIQTINVTSSFLQLVRVFSSSVLFLKFE